MPRTPMGKQITSLRENVSELVDTNNYLRAEARNVTDKLKSTTAVLNGKSQAVADLRKKNSELVESISNTIKARDAAFTELRLSKACSKEMETDIDHQRMEVLFLDRNRFEALNIIDNAFTLLYPHLEHRDITENTDILDPNDRLLIRLKTILIQPYNDFVRIDD